MKMFFSLFLFCSLGCGTVGVTVMRNSLPNRENCSLDIFSSENEVRRPYEVLCLIDARTGGTAFADKTVAGAIKLAKPEACRCGADAIFVSSARAEGVTLSTWGEGFAILKAIKYIGDK